MSGILVLQVVLFIQNLYLSDFEALLVEKSQKMTLELSGIGIQSSAIILDIDQIVIFRQKVCFQICWLCAIMT